MDVKSINKPNIICIVNIIVAILENKNYLDKEYRWILHNNVKVLKEYLEKNEYNSEILHIIRKALLKDRNILSFIINIKYFGIEDAKLISAMCIRMFESSRIIRVLIENKDLLFDTFRREKISSDSYNFMKILNYLCINKNVTQAFFNDGDLLPIILKNFDSKNFELLLMTSDFLEVLLLAPSNCKLAKTFIHSNYNKIITKIRKIIQSGNSFTSCSILQCLMVLQKLSSRLFEVVAGHNIGYAILHDMMVTRDYLPLFDLLVQDVELLKTIMPKLDSKIFLLQILAFDCFKYFVFSSQQNSVILRILKSNRDRIIHCLDTIVLADRDTIKDECLYVRNALLAA